MASRFMACSLEQPLLLSPDLREWLEEDHLALFVGRAVSKLKLQKLLDRYERKDRRGRLGYHPEMLLRVMIYAYSVGIVSSRKIESAAMTDVAFRVLAANQRPDHTTISEFRKENLDLFQGLFLDVLQMCRLAGLTRMGVLALDGTKMKADASRHESYTYPELQQLRKKVEEILEQAEVVDREEDARDEALVDRMPEGWKTAGEQDEALAQAQKQLHAMEEEQKRMQQQQQRQKQVEQARRKQAELEQAAKQLEERARQKAEASAAETAKAKQEGRKLTEAERKRGQRARKGLTEPAGRVNLTDADSRLMLDRGLGCYVQGYNAQAIVDVETQVIVAADVTNQEADRNQIAPMMELLEENREALRKSEEGSAEAATTEAATTEAERVVPVVLADAGYWDGASVEAAAEAGRYRVLVAPDGPNGQAANGPKSAIGERMRQELTNPEAKALYRRRGSSIEPVFGQIKEGRKIRGFRLRGEAKVKGEWALVCLTHNLLKLYRKEVTVSPKNGLEDGVRRPRGGSHGCRRQTKCRHRA